MNIKTFVNSVLPTDTSAVKKTGNIKSNQTASDRDADGRRNNEREDATPEKEQLTDEEVAIVLKVISEIPGVKNSTLMVRKKIESQKQVFVVQDNLGKTVKTFTVNEAWGLVQMSRNGRVGLLNRTA